MIKYYKKTSRIKSKLTRGESLFLFVVVLRLRIIIHFLILKLGSRTKLEGFNGIEYCIFLILLK
jgi:hypothetical protein